MRKSSRSVLPEPRPEKANPWLEALKTSPHPLGVIRLGGPGRMLFFNRAFTKATGYTTRNAPTLQSWASQAFPSRTYRQATFGKWKQCVLGRRMTRPYQHKVKVRTVRGNDIHAICNTMRSGDLAVFCFTDVTESETRLERLQNVIHALPYPVALEEYRPGRNNRNPRFLLMNRTFQEKLGYNGKVCPRVKDLLRRIYPDPAYRKKVYQGWLSSCARQEKGKNVAPVEATARAASGAKLHLLIHTILLKDIGVRMVTLTDITPQKQLIETLNRENQTAENQRLLLRKRLKSSLVAASVAHEIDTSLGVILLQAKSALRDLLKEPRRNAAMILPLQNILNQAEGINQTIDRIRALIGSMDTRQEKVDLAAVVDSALLSLKDRIRENQIKVRNHYVGKKFSIIGDETQIYLIVLNLLRNAVNALSRKKGQKRLIQIKIVRKGGGITILIEDSGDNIQSGELQKVTRWSSGQVGLGIGLFLVRSSVDNHHGRIHFGRSRLKGWKVIVWLPVAPPQKKTPRDLLSISTGKVVRSVGS